MTAEAIHEVEARDIRRRADDGVMILVNSYKPVGWNKANELSRGIP